MAKKVVTNDGKKGGWLVGKRHYDKSGKPLGGIKAVVTDAGGKPVELEGGEVIINREASKKYWKELSKINQSAGNGVPIEPPSDAFDEDPNEDYENGGKIEFNANHIPNKWILNYAIKIKEEHPEIWKLGGNIFGNQAFINLKRVAERGHWLDSEEWMYKKWRSYVARHQRDYRIEGVVAMLKWVDKVEKGWQYMKNLIEEKIKKLEARKSKKMNDGGNVDDTNFIKVDKYILSRHPKNGDVLRGGKYQDYEIVSIKKVTKSGKVSFKLWLKKGINRRIVTYTPQTKKISDFIKVQKGYAKGFRYDEWSDGPIGKQMNDGGNVGRTPAPLSERIKGSKFNASGSAKDSTSGKDIKFDDKTIASIQSLIDAHNEKYPSKKITLAVAKAVVRRGMGAYSSSHRPTITGGKPNSRTAWGLARLKAFIHKAEKGKSKSGKYSQDNDLFDDLDINVQKMNDGGLLAPNGKQSNLTLEQYKLVRTPAFKQWFGDWENDPKNASKVVDENGEPLVVYRGIKNSSRNIFNRPKNKRRHHIDSRYIEWYEFGSFFTSSISDAEDYAEYKFGIESEQQKGKVLKVFLNIKNPLIKINKKPISWTQIIPNIFNSDYSEDADLHDGFISNNTIEIGTIGATTYHVKNPTQIKLADGTNTTFDGSNPDIRFEDGGLIAPNGNKSNLTPQQYQLVRTPEFKAWFGDWENDSKNASKVVDFKDYNNLSKPYTNEPLVVYHASFNDFNEFDKNRIGQREEGWFGKGIYFGTNELQVKRYGPIVKPYFLQIKKPFQFEGHQKDFAEKFDLDYNQPNFGNSVNEILTKQGFDGLIIDSVWGKEYIVFEPNQIKIADGTNTTFDANNPDIRFDKGGEIEKGIKAEYEHAKTIAKFKREGVSVRDVARSIAEDHLKEDPHYYSKLEKMEGKKFATGGIVENGISINIGDTGLYGRSKEQITITGITTKIVNFTTSDGKKKGIYIDSFAKNYIPDNPSNYVQSGSNKSTSPQTSGEWRVKTFDELKEQGLLVDYTDTYRGISNDVINNWAGRNVKEIDKDVLKYLDSGRNSSFAFDGYSVKSDLFTKDPLPTTQSNVVHELNNYRIKTEQELLKEFGKNFRVESGFSTNKSMDWLFGKKITEIVLPSDYDDVLQKVKNNKRFSSDSSFDTDKTSWNIFNDMYMFDPVLNSQNVGANEGKSKPLLPNEALEELFKDVKEIDKEREALEATPQKNETQINDELKALEDEYNDLLFLIDITPSTDVDNMLALKLQAKQLKDKIDLLHLDLKKKIDGELELLENLFNASSIQPQERYKFNPYNDGFAPDGQPTSLPKNLYDWTMTQEFQNWFGNFTNAYNYRNSSYENVPCSVVVNKHYEPLVVYHGTGVEFSFFKFNKFPAMYFAENEAYSNWFAEIKGQQSGTNGYVYPFFLNIRTPLDLTIYGINPVSPDEFIDWMFLQTGLDADELKISKALLDPSQKFQAWMYLRNSPEMLNVLRDKAICDGIIYYEDNPSVDQSSDAYQTKAYIVFNSNSAKIADPNREMMTIPAMRSFYLKRGGKL